MLSAVDTATLAIGYSCLSFFFALHSNFVVVAVPLKWQRGLLFEEMG